MKKLVMSGLLIMAAGAMLFAQGIQGENGVQAYGQRFISDEVTVSGIFEDTGNEVVLTTDEGIYSLSAIHLQMVDFSDYNGSTVTVEGTLADENLCPEGYDGHIFVETAEVNGEEFSFDTAGRWSDDEFYGARGGNSMMDNRGYRTWDNDEDDEFYGAGSGRHPMMDKSRGNRNSPRSNGRGMTGRAGNQNWNDSYYDYRGAQGPTQSFGQGRVF